MYQSDLLLAFHQLFSRIGRNYKGRGNKFMKSLITGLLFILSCHSTFADDFADRIESFIVGSPPSIDNSQNSPQVCPTFQVKEKETCERYGYSFEPTINKTEEVRVDSIDTVEGSCGEPVAVYTCYRAPAIVNSDSGSTGQEMSKNSSLMPECISEISSVNGGDEAKASQTCQDILKNCSSNISCMRDIGTTKSKIAQQQNTPAPESIGSADQSKINKIEAQCANKQNDPACAAALDAAQQCKSNDKSACRSLDSHIAGISEDPSANPNEEKQLNGSADPDMQDEMAEQDAELYEARIKQCQSKGKEAQYCCGSGAVACLAGFKESDGMGSLIGTGSVILQSLILARQTQSVQENCDSQEGLSAFSAGINAATAVKCHTVRSSCQSDCGLIKQELEAKQNLCSAEATSCKTTYKRLIGQLNFQINTCKELVTNEVGMGAQAATTLVTTHQMAKLCKEVVAASPPPVAPGIPGNDLCKDPTDLSNPYCRQQFCAQPGSLSLPECQGPGSNTPPSQKVGLDGSNSFGSANFGSRGANADLNGIGDGLGEQLPATGNNEINGREVVSTQGGTGGLPGGGGGGGGAPADSGGGGGAANKLNTNTLHGLASGNGYSVSSMGLSGGGGYSNPVRNGSNKKAKPFDLKQFLPKKNIQRKLAGLSASHSGLAGQLAGKHDDIFKRVSNKYREMCILNRLYCPKAGQR